MVSVMSPIRITAAGERLVEPIIALAHCSKLARIIVTGADSAEAVIDLHRLGYARATTTSNCGLPAGQAPSFFRRTSGEVCAAITVLEDPRRITILEKHIARIDDPRLRRAFHAAVDLERGSRPAATEHKRQHFWAGVRS